MTKTITIGEDGFVLLSTFADYMDIRKVKYYSVKTNKDKTLTLKFYDGKRKPIKLNESK